MEDEKYVVFKREDWDRYVADRDAGRSGSLPYVPDAVVIRTQDIFAGPALDMYASAVALAAKLIPKSSSAYFQLMHVADYFHTRAEEARDQEGKIPD